MQNLNVWDVRGTYRIGRSASFDFSRCVAIERGDSVAALRAAKKLVTSEAERPITFLNAQATPMTSTVYVTI